MKILNQKIDLLDFFHKVHTGPSLLMLDYDGTLAPFVNDRMQAYPYRGVIERLNALIDQANTLVVIVSGRSLADLESLLVVNFPLELWGSHGLERKLPNGKRVQIQLAAHTQEGLRQGIDICTESGLWEWCEKKPYSIALHWRGQNQLKNSDAITLIEQYWGEICTIFALEIHKFDGGIELRPKGKNKSDVVVELLHGMQSAAAIAYLGDDLTDEDAFKALGDRGLKILVRKEWRPTLADIQLIPPKEVLTFFDDWINHE